MSRSAIVFGGNGFIGRHLLGSLKSRGYKRLVAVDIRPEHNPLTDVEYVYGDVRQSLDRIATGAFDEAYNLAAIHTTPGHEDHEYYDTNVSGAINVVRYCESHGISTLCFTSSIAVYGPDEDAKSEESVLNPVSAYGKSKLQAEEIHRIWADRESNRRLSIVRPAVVFGPGEGGNFTRLPKALATGIFFYPGRRDTIKGCGYVGELVRTIEFSLGQTEKIYLYNFCYPVPYTIQDICEAYCRVADLPKPRGTVPTSLMKVATLPFEALNAAGVKNGICRARVLKLVHSTHIVPGKLVSDGYEFETDLDEALVRWRDSEPIGNFL
jgi:nucleoside-diphosphate-sugar epimerase